MSDIQKVATDTPSIPQNPERLARILIVDDEAVIRQVLEKFLQHEQYDVTLADSAEAAIEILQNNSFEIILSDVMMPGKSGTDLLQEIKEKHPNQEFILMTAYPKITAAVYAIKTGAFEYLSKPFDFNKLKSTIENALQHRQDRLKHNSQKTNQIAGYNIIKTIGEGTMGLVFLVDKEINGNREQFAIKVIKNHSISKDDDRLERFFREASSASQMNNPHIIKVFQYGYAHEENIPYLVMEYFQGKTLQDIIPFQARYTYKQKIHIIIQVAKALHDTHKNDIVHRDIKPDNILINRQLNVKLSDFGIAQLPNSEHTNLMRIVGTPYYLSPEAYNCPKVDYRADFYSLGTVAYELFTGKKPFDAENINALGFQIQSDNPKSPQEIIDGFPLPIQKVLEKLLKKKSSERYQSASEIIEDLTPLLKAQNLQQRPGAKDISWNTL